MTHDGSDAAEMLLDYFQLNRVCLADCYQRWSKDANFKKKSVAYAGVRMLRQDPFENLICFICSSNNNIARISMMVQKLCEAFGNKIGVIDGIPFHSFPSLSSLLKPDLESRLRELGFGYRAKYIHSTVSKLMHDNENDEKVALAWLASLREMSYDDARQHLLSLDGIGPKVADCILLMSLDKSESIPVDTHVLSVALRDYGIKMKTKSLTDTLYREIGDMFRNKFSPFAGWAHSVLFAADLSKILGEQKAIEPSSSSQLASSDISNGINGAESHAVAPDEKQKRRRRSMSSLKVEIIPESSSISPEAEESVDTRKSTRAKRPREA